MKLASSSIAIDSGITSSQLIVVDALACCTSVVLVLMKYTKKWQFSWTAIPLPEPESARVPFGSRGEKQDPPCVAHFWPKIIEELQCLLPVCRLFTGTDACVEANHLKLTWRVPCGCQWSYTLKWLWHWKMVYIKRSIPTSITMPNSNKAAQKITRIVTLDSDSCNVRFQILMSEINQQTNG